MDITTLLFIAAIAGVGVLTFLLVNKKKQVRQLQADLQDMTRTFNDLDEQAKLIVRTDLELNRAQEELDKRLNGLDALQKTSRLISTTLDENEIFKRLDQSLIVDLGFEKNLICIYDKDHALQGRLNVGFSAQDVQFVIAGLEKEKSLTQALKEGHAFTSAASSSHGHRSPPRGEPLAEGEEPIGKQAKKSIIHIFDVEHFVLTPILTQGNISGILFVGNRSNASAITEGDEELISVLANQIGQALENARLFEQAYGASQALETKVQERTKQLALALEEVSEINKMKSEFISAVSHELRTPLTSIKGYASLLITGKLGVVPEAVKERLEKINTHSDNLVKMINNLLDIARIESGRVEMKMEKCDITSIIETAHDMLTPQMKEKNLRWETDVGAGVPELILDKHQVERVFINLVGNAIKFTPENGTITIRVCHDPHAATIEVSDTGIGVSEADLHKLFDEFYRVDNEINQNVKGTGLGLSLVKKIVDIHKGKIWVTSELNRGTTFHFTLPFDPAAPVTA